MDGRPYVNVAAVSVTPDCPIARVFTIFRSMGIRHLPVVNTEHRVIGIITRKELMSEPLYGGPET